MHGLYRSRFEHDSCGVSFLADLKGRRTHHLVSQALEGLCNMEHRGAQGADPDTGDGAGILVQVPDRFLRAAVSFDLPLPGRYITGIGFFPDRADLIRSGQEKVEQIVAEEGLEVLGWREPHTNPSVVGKDALKPCPPCARCSSTGWGRPDWI